MSERPLPPVGTVAAIARVQSPLPPGLRLEVVRGPDRGRSADLPPAGHGFRVGSDPASDLVLSDPLVSRAHLEIHRELNDLLARDMGSRNGSYFEGARFESLRLDLGATVRIGDTELQVRAGGPSVDAGVPGGPGAFGDFLYGPAQSGLFLRLERAATTDAVVLLEGETGTGKELVAHGIHQRSRRHAGPYVVCDLGGVSGSLIESELFGHLRGSFTGADRDREGAFALASGGTIFLDEVGELSLELQPRLLRVLERRQVKPVGSSVYRDVNVRIIAATNRDLAAEVRAGRFRRDLFHRLSVMNVHLPPLRQRAEDIPRLVHHFIERIAGEIGRPVPTLSPEAMGALVVHDWPGNVRELRNVIERAISVSADAERLSTRLLGLGSPGGEPEADESVPFKEAKERLIQAWEREYLAGLLDKADGNVTLAARNAGLARTYLHDLLDKHGIAR